MSSKNGMDGGGSSSAFRVGQWQVDPSLGELRCRGEIRQLEPRVMQVLVYLASRPGEAVTKDDLVEKVWEGAHVTDNAIARSVTALRKALGDDWRSPRYVQTLSKRGYRLIAAVGADDSKSGTARSGLHPTQSSPRGAWHAWTAIGLTALAAAVILPLLSSQEPSSLTLGQAVPFTTLPGRELYPNPSPDGSRVAFVWSGGQESSDPYDRSNWDLYVKGSHSEELIRLTRRPGPELGPAWSPQGDSVAFFRSGEQGCQIYGTRVDGGSPKVIGACQEAPHGMLDWSPGGGLIAYSDGLPRGIYLMDIQSGASRLALPPDPSTRGDQYPVFSPNGRWLAFSRTQSDGRGDIYRVRLDGSRLQRLTRLHRGVYGMDWTPDGSQIVFASNLNGRLGLWTLTVEERSVRALQPVEPVPFWPRVSDASRQVVYTRFRDDTDIWALDLTSGQAVPAIDTTREDLQPQAAPDGRRLAFLSNRSGFYEVWTSDPEGGQLRRETDFQGAMVSLPRWSPDSRQLVFDADLDGQSDIYIAELDGGRPRVLRAPDSLEANASWSEDGESLYYASNRSGRWEIWRSRRDGSQPRQITRRGGFNALEDDEGNLLYTKHDQSGLWRMPAAGGPEEHLIPEIALGDWANWTVHGAGIYFIRRRPRTVVARYDLQTGRIEEIHSPGRRVPYSPHCLAVSPDGRHILFAQTERSDADILMQPLTGSRF